MTTHPPNPLKPCEGYLRGTIDHYERAKARFAFEESLKRQARVQEFVDRCGKEFGVRFDDADSPFILDLLDSWSFTALLIATSFLVDDVYEGEFREHFRERIDRCLRFMSKVALESWCRSGTEREWEAFDEAESEAELSPELRAELQKLDGYIAELRSYQTTSL